jgi:predicted MPP superfamily phosphohydrolase
VAVLLLAHHPDQLIDVPSRVGLTLSGHTHGGQVVLPWLGALHTGSDYGQRFAQGLVFASGPGSARGFVSRGLGTTFLPLRFGCPAEVVELHLEPE